jgi:hypothetical protein
MRKVLQTPEAFEKTLREEVSVSAEFDLPLAALALVVEGGWQEEDVRRALDTLRAVDLVVQPAAEELLVALPNTRTADARVVEERLREAVPRATVGVASYRRGDTAEDLLECAREAICRRVRGEARSYLRPARRTTGPIDSKAGGLRSFRGFRAFSRRAPRSERAASGQTRRRGLRGRGRTL